MFIKIETSPRTKTKAANVLYHLELRDAFYEPCISLVQKGLQDDFGIVKHIVHRHVHGRYANKKKR